MASPSPFLRAGKWLLRSGIGTCAGLSFAEHCYTMKLSTGPSMYPTLQPEGDWLLISRWRHRYGRDVRLGDVVACKNPLFAGEYAAKRVLGMPGDLVLRDAPRGDNSRHPEDMMIEVPDGHVWLIGDNLPWSRDSREYGPVPLGMVLGKVIAKGPCILSMSPVANTLDTAKFSDDDNDDYDDKRLS